MSDEHTERAFDFSDSSGDPLLETIAPRYRAKHAFEIDRATRFSDDRSMRDTVGLLQEIQKHPEIWDDLERDTTERHTYERRKTGACHVVGRPRMPGHWALIGCAWLLQREPDVQVFFDTARSTNLWQTAGFSATPSYSTTVERLAELEVFTVGFNRASAKLWRTAMRQSQEIGRHVWIDATAYESHAVPHHECLDAALCAAHGGRDAPTVLERATIGEANKNRQDAAGEAEPESDALDVTPPDDWEAADIAELVLDELESATQPRHPKYVPHRHHRGRPEPREVFLAWNSTYRHRYVIRDGDAGCRTYAAPNSRKKRSWVGGLKLTATDFTTGAEITHLYVPADQSEHENYEQLIERVKAILGRYPENVILDRGYNTLAIHQLNERLGIGQVMPWRAHGAVRDRRMDRIVGTVDEYGVPVCQFCGSPGTTLAAGCGHQRKDSSGAGYVVFRCANPHTDDCRVRKQSIACREAPRLLGVLSHEEELYWELRLHGRERERAHSATRARYRDAGKNSDTRVKILGIGILEARGAIARFLEILRVCLRHGWFGNWPNVRPARLRQAEGGKRGLAAFRRLRRKQRLVLPAGPAAEALGLVFQGELPKGWVPIHERRKKAKDGRPGRQKSKPDAPPARAPDDGVPF